MPSVKRPGHRHLTVLALSAVLGAGSLGGCSTTQEMAAAHQEEATRILEARAKRQKARKNGKHKADGTKSASPKRKSARREEGER